MWTSILNTIVKKLNPTVLLILALAGALAFGAIQCDRKKAFKAEAEKQKNNISALTDVVGFYQNLAGELTAEKLAFQTDNEQLKELNGDLYEQVEKEKDKVDQITQINAELRADTTETDTTYQSRVGIDEWRFNWSIERQGQGWHKVLEGFTHFHISDNGVPYNSRTLLTKDLLTLQLVTGITDDDGQKRIFVRSTYPGLTVTNIQGAILNDSPIETRTPSRFGLGFNVGGTYLPSVGLTPTVSAGINFNLIRF